MGMFDEIGLARPGSNTVIVGFSQGGMLACDLLLHEVLGVEAVALLSASCVALDEWQLRADRMAGMRALVAHGRHDDRLSFSAGERLRDFLLQAGADVRWHPFEGILPNFERRFRETDSAAVREDLVRYQSAKPCPDCLGTRLRREARNVFLVNGDESKDTPREPIYRVEHFTLRECLAYFESLTLAGNKAEIADKVVREIRSRLKFLNDVGLNYLSLDRSADSLSGGEAQRIRLASQIGSGLTGVMYVLDEPSIGLHARDQERLLRTLEALRDRGNTVVVVEHDEDMIRAADHVVDMGPGAGVHGGRVVSQGTPAQIAADANSLTGRYLARALRIEVPRRRRAPDAPHGVLTFASGIEQLSQAEREALPF